MMMADLGGVEVLARENLEERVLAGTKVARRHELVFNVTSSGLH